MQPEFRRLSLWGGALVLMATPGMAAGQDGQAPVGPKVTSPRTDADKVNRAHPITDSPPVQTGNPLPAVPETASDPAPPGTRGVRVDGPAAVPGQPAEKTGSIPKQTGTRAGNPATRAVPGVKTIEGVVIRLSAPGDALAEERIRIRVDQSQDWDSYAGQGATGLPHRVRSQSSSKSEQALEGRTRPRTTVAETSSSGDGAVADSSEDRQGVDVTITHRTYVFTFARSPEGHDLLGVDNPSAPDVQSSRTGQTVRGVVASPNPKEASYTNIREGSYVAVRYRTVGDVHEALNISLIELPTNSAPPTALPVGLTPGGSPAGASTAPTSPSTAPGLTPAPVPAPTTTPAGVRVPVVPVTPTSPPG